MPDTKCESCGAELQIGAWPWCPHEPARNFGEEPLEPYWDEHVSLGGAEITTRAQRRKLMDKGDLEYRKRKSPPGERIFVDLGRR